MRPRSLALLALLVVGLLAFIWFFERELPSSDERTELAKRILVVDEESVDGLVVEWEQIAVELVREPGAKDVDGAEGEIETRTWRLVRPLTAPADAAAVDSLVRRLVGLERLRTLEGVSRSDVGLAEPRARVTLAAGESETVLEIGAEIPASSNMTLAVAGTEEVYVVPSSIWADLTKEPGDWRDKSLFRGKRGDIERISLRGPGEAALLAKRGDDFWLEAPVVDRADRSQIESLLSQITGLKAESFVDQPSGDLEDLGLIAGAGAVEVVLEGSAAPWRLEIGGPVASEAESVDAPASGESGEHYARLGEQLVTTRSTLPALLAKAVAEWRSREWATSEAYEIDRAVIEDGDGETEIRRADGDWLRNGESIAYGPATDLLYEITDAEAAAFLDSPVETLGDVVLTVTLEAEEVDAEVLTVHAAREEGYPARSSGRDAILLLSADTVAELRSKLDALRIAPLDTPVEEPSPQSDSTGEAEQGTDAGS